MKRDVTTKGVPVLLTFGSTVYISDARFSVQHHGDDWVRISALDNICLVAVIIRYF